MRCLFLLVAALAMPAAATSPADDFALVDAKLIVAPDAEPVENGAILVRDGRIVAVGARSEVVIPAGVPVIDGSGLTATAGFWNSHVHITTPELLRARTASAESLSQAMREMFLGWGFTTVFDVASSLENTNILRARIASGEVAGPRILTVGDPFYPKDGTPIYVRRVYEEYDLSLSEVSSPAEAAARVATQAQSGAEGVKMFAGAIVGGDVGVLPMDVGLAAAIVEAAHERRLPVFAHPTNNAGLNVALQSGVDILTHSAPAAGRWDEARVKALLAGDVALIPTLDLFQIEGRWAKLPQEAIDREVDVAQSQVGAYWRAGGDILFGTDIGYTPGYDTAEEIRLMAEAGLDWRAILASLTTLPAERFGTGDEGRLAPGMVADLVLLEGDPTSDVAALSRVRCAIRGGVVLFVDADEQGRNVCPRGSLAGED